MKNHIVKKLITAVFMLSLPILGLSRLGFTSQALAYPDRPIKLVVPFGAGGIADVTARIVAEKLGDRLGQRLVIENVPGAGGKNAARAVLGNDADGYTLALLTNGTAISVGLFKELGFDPLKDFTPISNLGNFEFLFATHKDAPYQNFKEFLADAKARPNKLTIGTINIGSTQNLTAQLVKSASQIDVQIVPFRTSGEAVFATIRKDVDLVIDGYVGIQAGLQDKSLRVLTTSKDYDVSSWNAIFAKAGTPPAIINRLHQELQLVLKEEFVQKRLSELGIEAMGSTPEAIGERLKQDITRWGKVIEEAKIEKQ